MNERTLSYDKLIIPEVKYLAMSNSKIAYREMGEGEVIYMLPSWPANSIEYIPLMNLLSKKYHCIAIDFPYWTGYSTTTKKRLSIEDYVDIASEFFTSKINSKANLIGYSFSVPVATLLKIKYEKQINKVILVSGFFNGKGIRDRHPILLHVYKLIRAFTPEFLVSYIVRKILFNTYKETVYYKEYKDTPLFVGFFKMIEDLEFKKALNSILDVIDKDYTNQFLQAYEQSLPLLIWAEKDPDFIIQAMGNLDDMLCSEDHTLRLTDHNHLTFDVFKSAKYIEAFLSK